ncbi:MAG: hydrogenase nickel incorporation protein HypB, partial [Firmicutes bacterium]|nr:hydrogenase nickel incorporation protein HypB [Bacillota bacterium]
MDKQGAKKSIYLLGNTGSGKTQLIRRTHETLRGRVQVKAIYYQPNSVYDVDRLSAAGIPAEIRTETFQSSAAEQHVITEEAGDQLLFYEFSGRTGYSLP